MPGFGIGRRRKLLGLATACTIGEVPEPIQINFIINTFPRQQSHTTETPSVVSVLDSLRVCRKFLGLATVCTNGEVPDPIQINFINCTFLVSRHTPLRHRV